MKNFEQIYNDIRDKFYSLTKIDVSKGSIMDMMLKSMSYMLHEVYKLIEKNKQPYLFTKQTGKELDSTGYFLQCPRQTDESDENYLYRLMKWVQRNATNNTEAINDAIKTLSFSSSATYVPFIDGIGTACVYLIPYQYEDEYIKSAISEAKQVIEKIVSPSTIIEYSIPEPVSVKLVAYLDVAENSDMNYIKQNARKMIKEYINGIAPGNKLMLGYINNIILDIEGVEYFNVVQIYLNDKESTNFEILQTVSTKMLFDEIIWWEVEN